MSKIKPYIKVILLVVFALFMVTIGWVGWLSSRSLTTVKTFYSQYNQCVVSSDPNNCLSNFKKGQTVSSVSILTTELKNLTIDQRKFQLGLDFYNLPILKNTNFSLKQFNLKSAQVVMSGSLDLGEDSLTNEQKQFLENIVKESYPGFILSKPLSYKFDLVRVGGTWQINDITYTPALLGQKAERAIAECKTLLKAENKIGALCVENNNKVNLIPLTFNKAGFLANQNTKDNASEIPSDLTAEKNVLSSIKDGSLVIYVVDFAKLTAQNYLNDFGVDTTTKNASLSSIAKPTQATSFCAIVTPSFKDGALSIYPETLVNNNSILVDKAGYLICSPKVSWNGDNFVWGVAGYFEKPTLNSLSGDSYLGIKLLLPSESYYGKDFNAFDYSKAIGNSGKAFYRLAIPLQSLAQ